MSDSVLVAIIGGMSLLLNGVVTTLSGILMSKLSRAKKQVAEINEQLVNHHPKQPNFREENDARHEETKRWFSTLRHMVRELDKRVNERFDTVNTAINDLVSGFVDNRTLIEQNTERIDEIEKGKNSE